MRLRRLIRTREVLLTVKNSAGRASITVFLSLTLLVILALLGTTVEVARGKACRIYGRRVLKNAADSLLTEYSRPLWEKYRLFFIEDGGKPFRQSIAEYAADTLEPETRLSGAASIYDAALSDVRVEELRYIGDDGGAALIRQIEDYMKRSLAADVVKKLVGKTKSLDYLEQSAEEIDRKAAEEKEAAADGRRLMELMELIDGVDGMGRGVTGRKYFVKMFCHGKKRPERFGVTETAVWNVMKENIVELQVYFGRLQTSEPIRRKFLAMTEKAGEKTRRALELVKELESSPADLHVTGDIRGVLTSNLNILETTGKLLGQPVGEETVAELKRLWKGYDTKGISFDYTGIGEKGGAPNPMDSFADAISGGLLKLVVEKGTKLSSKSVKNPDHYRKLYEAAEEEEASSDSLEKLTGEEVELQAGVRGIGRAAATDVMLCGYLKKYFSSVAQKAGEGRKCLDYEWEYIVCGGKSDRGNLENVVGRLVLLRGVINTAAILSSSSRRETAHTAALAVVGFTGMEPLIRFTQTLFTVLWGMAEALVDVAALLQGREVPLVKSPDKLRVEFKDLYQIRNEYVIKKARTYPKASSGSFGYSEYLMLFLMGNGTEKNCYRMMDLMEWNIRADSLPEFRLGICADSFQVTGDFSFATKLFRLPSVQDIVGRRLQDFQQSVRIRAGYTGG